MDFTIKISTGPKMHKILGITTAVIIIAVVFFSTVWFLNRGEQAIQGLSLGSVSVDKLQKNEATNRVKGVAENYLTSELVLKTSDGLEIKTTPQDMQIQIDIETSIKNVYSRGRNGSLAKKLYEQTIALFVGLNEPMVVKFDDTKLNEFMEFSLNRVHKPAQNATFEYNKESGKFEFVSSKMGIVVDKNDLRQKILNSGQTLSLDTIELLQKTDTPLVKTENASEDAKIRANELVENMPYIVISDEQSWEIEKEDLASWIKFVPIEKGGTYILEAQISKKAIEDYLIPFSPGLRINPTDASFEMNNERVETFSISSTGLELNISQSAEAIKQTIGNSEEEALLIFNILEPEITSESIDNLNITSLLGRGETDFAGSPKSRVHNITLGAKTYNGLLIAPGEEFSFNENLGPVTAAAGYLPELVIKRGATIPEYGGGLCQVSTTLFRAAVYSGLKISKRYAHSYAVSYYGKAGFDATIYPPSPDLGFINNTPGYILIQARVEGTKLIFEIYGQDDGRRTELDGPNTYDAQPNGAIKAWLKQTVYDKNDNIIIEKTFYSNYKSPSLYPVNRNPLE